MAKKNTSSDKKKNASFAVAAVILGAVLIVPILLLVVSTLLNSKTTRDLTKSLYPIKYEYYVESSAKEFGVDVCLVYGVIRTESGFDPNAVSQAGAIGLMQLMPETFTWLQNYRTDFMPEKLLDSSELYKPDVNIEYGTYLLRYLLDHYDGDVSLAIIAYNAGYGNVDNWLADGTIPKSGVTSANVPFTETANYLDRVTEAMEKYRELYYDELVLNFESEASSSAGQSSAPETVSEVSSEGPTAEQSASEYEGEYFGEPGGEYTGEEYGYNEEEYMPYAYEGDGTGAEYYE